jgi:N-acyl homoserine lactone hydrolase
MNKSRKVLLGIALLIMLSGVFGFVVYQPSIIPRRSFVLPEASYNNWDEILSHPQPISIRTYVAGVNRTKLSGIMNLEHERAQGIEDKLIDIPVNVGVIQHQQHGIYLIDAGLDASYEHNQYGTNKGMMVERFLAKGSLEPNTHIAAVLEKENIQLQGVWLTHLHMDHTAGVVDLPKDIPYVVGENERYANFRFFMHNDHLAGIDTLYEIDFAEGINLSPLGKAVDIFGDGSFWAISSSGHSAGHVMYFINGIEESVLYTGDACNDYYQFETGIGPGFYSSDLEGGQEVLEQIIAFKEKYPEVTLVFGHDLKTH